MPSRPVLIGRGLVIQTLNQHHKHTCTPTHHRGGKHLRVRVHINRPTPHPQDTAPGRVCGVHRVTAAIASGKHPVPSRTRKLSLTAPMVLQPRGCGRVGRRRTNIGVEATATRWPLLRFPGSKTDMHPDLDDEAELNRAEGADHGRRTTTRIQWRIELLGLVPFRGRRWPGQAGLRGFRCARPP